MTNYAGGADAAHTMPVIVMTKKFKKLKRQYSTTQRKHVRRFKRVAKKPLFTIPFLTFYDLFGARDGCLDFPCPQ